MDQILGFMPIPAMVVIVYLICECVKCTRLDNKWLPVIAGISGGVLGIFGMWTMYQFPADDIITAIALGIVSGMSATGINQIAKQLK